MATEAMLCEYCSHVDFSRFRHPTLAEIQSLNSGDKPVGDRFPLKDSGSSKEDPYWSLGLVSRIWSSKGHCVFCKAVTTIMDQQPHIFSDLADAGLDDPLCYAHSPPTGVVQPAMGKIWRGIQAEGKIPEYSMRRLQLAFVSTDDNNGLNPGVVSIQRLSRRRQIDCLQVYDDQRPWTPADAEDIFKHPQDPQAILFSGRKRPAMLDLRLPIQWLRHCQHNHDTSCGSTHGSNESGSSLYGPSLFQSMAMITDSTLT